MNDLDSLLRGHAPKPKRPLIANFTEIIMNATHKSSLAKHSARRQRTRLHINLFSRAGAVSLAALVLLSGSVAALALWPKPSVKPTSTQKLPSGNHIVGYDAENCHYLSDLNGEKPSQTSEKLYYEVKADSKLTDAALQASVQAVCEENISNNAVSAVMHQFPKETPGLLSTLAYTITAISKDKISVSYDSHYKTHGIAGTPNTTYTRFAKDLRIYNQSNKAAYGDLQVGDTVKMIVQDTSGKSTETVEAYDPFDHPELLIIQAIIEIPALTGDPNVFYEAVATDLVRLEPCDNSPTGLCQVYDFAR